MHAKCYVFTLFSVVHCAFTGCSQHIASYDLFWSSHYQCISFIYDLQIPWPAERYPSCIITKKLPYKHWQIHCYSIVPCQETYLAKNFKSLKEIQRRATKFILNDYTSDHKHRLVTLSILTLPMIYELNDILFFIRSLKGLSFSTCMNDDYFSFVNTGTKSANALKLK